MADLSKCAGDGCPQKETCLRFTIEARYCQSWLAFNPRQGDQCDYYLEVKDEDDK